MVCSLTKQIYSMKHKYRKKKNLTVRLPDEVLNDLQDYRVKHQVSLSQQIERMVVEFFRKLRGKKV